MYMTISQILNISVFLSWPCLGSAHVVFAERILIVPVDLKAPEWASGLSRSGRLAFPVCLSKHHCASSPVSSVYSFFLYLSFYLYFLSYSEKCPCHLCSLEMGDTVLCCCHCAFQTLIFVCLPVNGPRKEMGHKQDLTIHTAGERKSE